MTSPGQALDGVKTGGGPANGALRRAPGHLAQRLLTSLAIVPAIIAALIWMPSVGLLFVLMALSVVGALEFYAFLNRAGIPSFRIVGAAAGVVLLGVTYLGLCRHPGEDPALSLARARGWEGLTLAATVLVLMVRQFPQKNNPHPLPTIACTLLGVLYVPFLLNFLQKLALGGGGIGAASALGGRPAFFLLFYVVLTTKLTDAGAFFAGMAAGRHPLFPRLSPSKTWEGFVGGVLSGVAVSVAYFHLAGDRMGGLHVGRAAAAAAGALLAVTGMTGDLAESLLKRAATAKDSGTLLPGIGGLLDVLDSLLFTAPVFYLALALGFGGGGPR